MVGSLLIQEHLSGLASAHVLTGAGKYASVDSPTKALRRQSLIDVESRLLRRINGQCNDEIFSSRLVALIVRPSNMLLSMVKVILRESNVSAWRDEVETEQKALVCCWCLRGRGVMAVAFGVGR